ncbi:DUF1189 domain-containing protein [Sinobaca sp. H24]|uniref:DUF1189 domain-containing protein n=1 Tax=Sinobaca sp. H24 TaxID=2923376 RepID=UPI0020793B41|nr:DUF1189 domain-containing protein [Sinobaca sp. H24]
MSMIQLFIKSLYSPLHIARFRFQKITKTILYIFFLMALASIPAGIALSQSLSHVSDELDTLLQEDVPDFSIENGELISEAEGPQTIGEGGRELIFDPSGEVTAEEIASSGQSALLQEEVVIGSGDNSQVYSYSQAGSISFTKQELSNLAASLQDVFYILIPVAVVGLYLLNTTLKFIGIFALSVFGLMIRKTSPIPLSYRFIWTMSAFAVTLPTMIIALLDLFPFQIPAVFTIYWVIAFFMLYRAFRSLPRPKKSSSPA